MKLMASDVARIINDETFRAIIDKVRADQVSTFVNSHRVDTEAREEAHSILRALDKIEQALQSVMSEEAIKQKREKGRS
jgi:phosphomevalonate kinase